MLARPRRIALGLLLGLLTATSPVRAGTVEGLLFEDLDADGLLDPGEPGVAGVPLLLWWGASDRYPGASGADGSFTIDAGMDSHLLELDLPEGWRFSYPDQTWDPPVAGPTDDVVLARYGAAPHLRGNAERPVDVYLYSLGDSIPAGFNFCASDSNYLPDVQSDLELALDEPVMLRNEAIPGAHSEDLLTPQLSGGGANPQFVGNVIAEAPDVVTVNIGGNDFLDTDRNLQANLQALIDTRATTQEIAASLLLGLPNADMIINTVYDNEADDCASSDFHARLTPIWTQVVRWLGTGQTRPVQVAEAALDFAHQNVTRTQCAGAEGRICTFPLDLIHPIKEGADIIQRAMMESLGEVRVPAADTISGVQLGLLRRVAELEPSVTTVVSGAVTDESAALSTNDAGAVLPPDSELRLSGYALPEGITPRVLIVRVRFRTTGDFADDHYRFEASFEDFARPATLSVTNWDYVTPIVGGSGTVGSGQGLGASRVNAVPDRPDWVEVSARATLNLVDDGNATGFYEWRQPTADDLAALQVRLRVDSVAGADAATVEWDSAVVEVYGQGELVGPTVGEVSDVLSGEPPLLVTPEPSGGVHLSWDPEPGAATYRVYRGALPAATGVPGAFDSAEAGTRCTPETELVDAEEAGSSYFLVTALDASGFEGPVGSGTLGPRSVGGADCP